MVPKKHGLPRRRGVAWFGPETQREQGGRLMKDLGKVAAPESASAFRKQRRYATRPLGHPLYVNGHLYQEPVTISHVPGAIGNYYDVPAGLGDVDPSMGALGAYVAYSPQLPPLGADELPGSDKASLAPDATPAWAATLRKIYNFVAPVTGAASIYHGYKRNDSIGWALWWGLMGAAFPIITIPIALAQGFGKPRGMTANRSRRSRAAKKGARTREAGGTKLWDVISTRTNSSVGTIVAPGWKSWEQVEDEARDKHGADVYVASKRKQNPKRRRR